MTALLKNNRSGPEGDASMEALSFCFFFSVLFWTEDRHVLDWFEYDRKEVGDERRGRLERVFKGGKFPTNLQFCLKN